MLNHVLDYMLDLMLGSNAKSHDHNFCDYGVISIMPTNKQEIEI